MKTIALVAFFLSSNAFAEVIFTPDLNLDLEFHYYSHKPNDIELGHKHRSKLGLETKFTDNLNLYNSLNALFFSVFDDQEKRINLNDDNLEIFLGENYLNYTKNSWQLKAGYQIIAWGESFAFNYADVINPKDQRETFYFDYSNSRLPSFIVNYRYFLENGSLEFIYSPEVRYSKNLPLNLVLKDEIPGINLKTKIQEKENFFDENDYGVKFSQTLKATDISLFYFNYMDKNPFYSLYSINNDGITLAENHNRISSMGLSLAKTVNDEYVVRSDVVYHHNKMINSFSSYNLTSEKSDMRELTVSLDTPSFHNISGLLLFAQSSLVEDLNQALREKHLYYALARLTYDFKEDRKLDLSYTKEFPNDASAVLAVFNYPYNDTLELRLGAEYYWGSKDSQLSRLKDISSVFIGFKNYFNL